MLLYAMHWRRLGEDTGMLINHKPLILNWFKDVMTFFSRSDNFQRDDK